MSLGIIGGTGLYRLAGLELEARRVATAYGEVEVNAGALAGRELVFLARHGGGHQVPPHRVNYRANLAALKLLGVTDIVATAAVGTLNPHLPPGSLALVTDFIDATEGRPRTFFDQDVIHLDYSEPYCPRLRTALLSAAAGEGVPLQSGATYLCTNGPRFETPAEIRMYSGWGADLVGMTNVPEVVLAREAELCYATIAVATNSAAGLAGQKLTHGEVEEMMAARMADLAKLFTTFAASHEGDAGCACRHALDEYRARRGEPELGLPRG